MGGKKSISQISDSTAQAEGPGEVGLKPMTVWPYRGEYKVSGCMYSPLGLKQWLKAMMVVWSAKKVQ